MSLPTFTIDEIPLRQLADTIIQETAAEIELSDYRRLGRGRFQVWSATLVLHRESDGIELDCSIGGEIEASRLMIAPHRIAPGPRKSTLWKQIEELLRIMQKVGTARRIEVEQVCSAAQATECFQSKVVG